MSPESAPPAPGGNTGQYLRLALALLALAAGVAAVVVMVVLLGRTPGPV